MITAAFPRRGLTAADPRKPCAHCGAEMARRRQPSGKLESIPIFTARKYCGEACWKAARRTAAREPKPAAAEVRPIRELGKATREPEATAEQLIARAVRQPAGPSGKRGRLRDRLRTHTWECAKGWAE